MVTGEASKEAVELAGRHSSLAVGLHLVITGGSPVLDVKKVPNILAPNGRLRSDPLKAGLLYALCGEARAQIIQEIKAQFQRFRQWGLTLDHVSGHQNLHLHPAILPVVISMARHHGAGGIRIPLDDLALALRHRTPSPLIKILWAVSLGPLNRWAARRLDREGMGFPCRVYGLFQSGSMTQSYLSDVIEGLDCPSAEIYLHPSLDRSQGPWGPNPEDLSLLLSDSIRLLVEERGIRLAGYRDVFAVGGGASWRPSRRPC
jgi:predicted glycoside hydrolase/deacetylase ChbG (UPF0249 family)